MCEFGVAQKWCCDVHNVAANRKLDWRSVKERKTGYMLDISMFRFHSWEPIWYYDPRTKQPANSLKKARWLSFAHLAGDAMTYFSEPELDNKSKCTTILVQSIIQTRRKNIRTKEEYTNNDPMLADFFLDPMELVVNKNYEMVDEATATEVPITAADPLDHGKFSVDNEVPTNNLREEHDPSKALPPGEADNDKPLTPEEMERLYDQFEMEDDGNYKFDFIFDYEFQDGILVLKAHYYDDDIGEHDLAVPFPILKRDVPLKLAHFIRDKVVKDRRGGHYNLWAKSTLKAHARGARRLHRSWNVDPTYRIYQTQRAKAN
jgi:hypothetical protein